MAQIFNYELGNLILRPEDFENKECPGWLPSPEQLKRKILIKGKKVKAGGNYEEDDENDEGVSYDDEEGASSIGGSSRSLGTYDSSSSLGSGTSASLLDTISENDEDVESSNNNISSGDLDDGVSEVESTTDTDVTSATASTYSLNSDISSEVGSEVSDSPVPVRGLYNKKGRDVGNQGPGKRPGRGMYGSQSTTNSSKSSDISNNDSSFTIGTSSNIGSSNDLNTNNKNITESQNLFNSFFSKAQETHVKYKKDPTHKALSDVTFLGTCKHKEENSETTPCTMMSSFSEYKTVKTIKHKHKRDAWIKHNIQHIR
jgi:hypothetical protein